MRSGKVRGLSDTFLDDLRRGILDEIHELVQSDKTLSMFIRSGYVNIYYRGGSILRIEEQSKNRYEFHFDREYAKAGSNKLLSAIVSPDWVALQRVAVVNSRMDARIWLQQLPLLKQCMDTWFGQHPKDEREFQQVIARVNNSSKYTDYFIVDIEYTNTNNKNIRADMLALYWPRTRDARKAECGFRPVLTVIEFKIRDHALTGKAGILAHVNKLANALDCGDVTVRDLGAESLEVFRQLVRLELIECDGMSDQYCQVDAVDGQRVENLLLLADHDPDSVVLKRELTKVQNFLAEPNGVRAAEKGLVVKVARAGLCGFGLFAQNMVALEDTIASL